MASFLRQCLPRYGVSLESLERIFNMGVALSRTDGLSSPQVFSHLILTVRDALSEELVKREGPDSPSLAPMLDVSVSIQPTGLELTKR